MPALPALLQQSDLQLHLLATRPDIYPQLLTKTVGCMANRQIARDLGVAPATVDRQLGRLGRHCMLFHARLMADARPIRDVVIDGFVTFEKSQY